MQWMQIDKYPCMTQGLIFPKNDRGWILPDSEPDIQYEFRFKAGMKRQDAYQQVIDDLARSIEEFKKMGIE